MSEPTTRALVLRWGEAGCVVRAAGVAAIDEDGAAARVPLSRPPLPLAPAVPGAVDEPERHAAVRLIVRCQRRYLAFRVAAAVEIREDLRFYALPRVLRGTTRAPWLRGVALVRDALTGRDEPLPWLDLGALADWHTGNEAHVACAEG